MSSNPSPPDYELADRLALTAPAQVRAIGNPLRTTILGLLHERAATVTELATAVARPKSTVAHHVKVLAEAELVRVVRTRRVRAIEERFYGRTARMFYVPVEPGADAETLPTDFNDFEVAARESAAAYRDRQLWASSGMPASPRSGPPSSGSASRRWSASSTSCPGRGTPSTASPSASTRPTIRGCPRRSDRPGRRS